VLSLTLGATPSNLTLTRKRPSGRLLSPYNVAVCVTFIVLTFIHQAIVVRRAQASWWYSAEDASGQPLYPKRVPEDQDAEKTNSAVPETTSVLLLANAQVRGRRDVVKSGCISSAGDARTLQL